MQQETRPTTMNISEHSQAFLLSPTAQTHIQDEHREKQSSFANRLGHVSGEGKDFEDMRGGSSSRSLFSKKSRPKPAETGSSRPMASLVQALTLLPLSTVSTIRHPFKQAASKKAPDSHTLEGNDETTSPTETSELDGEANVDATTSELVEILESDTEEKVEGKVILRRRSKQLSKGRRGLRKTRAAHFESKMNTSDGSWDKFLKFAEGQSADMVNPGPELTSITQ
jgi:hypothetical protein